MEKFLVQDIQEIEKEGIQIATSGQYFNRLTEPTFKRFIGRTIRFFSEGRLIFETVILKVRVETTVSDVKNVFFLLPWEAKEKIKIGSEIQFLDIKY